MSDEWYCSFCGEKAYLRRQSKENKIEYLCNDCIELDQRGQLHDEQNRLSSTSKSVSR